MTATSRLWYRAVIADRLAPQQLSMLREEFTEAIRAVGWPPGACLFLVTRPRRGTVRQRGRTGDAATLFFSPAAIAAVPHLIAVCGAEPAPPPERPFATLLAGTNSDWDLLPRPSH